MTDTLREFYRPEALLNGCHATNVIEQLSHIRCIISDTDNTMISHGSCLCAADGTLSHALIDALIRAEQHGISIVPCTGRNRAMIREDVRMLRLKSWIGEMGGIICTHEGSSATWQYECADMTFDATKGLTPRELICQTGVVDDMLTRWQGALELYNDNGIGYQYREVTVAFRGTIPMDEAQAMLDRTSLALDFVDNGAVNRISGPTTLDVAAHADAHTGALAVPIHSYHICPRGLNKGFAAKKFMECMDLAPEEVLCCGDSPADCSMIDTGATFVLMANGAKDPACTQALAHNSRAFVSHKPASDGFCEMIDVICQAHDLKAETI